MWDQIKKHKNKVIIVLIIAAVLTAAFFLAEQPESNTEVKVREVSVRSEEVISAAESSAVSQPTAASVTSEQSEQSEQSEIDSQPSQKTSAAEKSSVSQVSAASENSRMGSSSASRSVVSSSAEPPQPTEQNETTVVEEVSENTEIENSVQQEEIPDYSQEQRNEPSQDEGFISSAAEISEMENLNICTVSVYCHTALNYSGLSDSVRSLQPSDGVIMQNISVGFEDGESVFDVTKKICTERNIPFEFSIAPMYHTAYIEGINNLYQFDCGTASGWEYSVNGKFYGYGCSEYKMKNGDRIEWLYTCDMGKDIGNTYNGG